MTDHFVDVVEFQFTADEKSVKKKYQLPNDNYNLIVGFGANLVTNQIAEVDRFNLNGRDVGFAEGVIVDDVFASHPIASITDRFFPVNLQITETQDLEITLIADFVAHTRKVYILLTTQTDSE